MTITKKITVISFCCDNDNDIVRRCGNAMSIDRYLQRTCAALSAISTSGYMRVIDISSFANIDEIRARSARMKKKSSARSLPGSSTGDDLSTPILFTLIETSYRLKSFVGPINRALIFLRILASPSIEQQKLWRTGIKVSSIYFHNLNYIDPFRRNCSFVKQADK